MNDQEIEFFIKSANSINQQKISALRKFFNILWNNALDDKLNIFKTSNFREFKKAKYHKLIGMLFKLWSSMKRLNGRKYTQNLKNL